MYYMPKYYTDEQKYNRLKEKYAEVVAVLDEIRANNGPYEVEKAYNHYKKELENQIKRIERELKT